MSKYKIISTKKTVITTVTKIVRIAIEDCVVKETYVNDKLTNQEWSTKGGFKNSHPGIYEPSSVSFRYYDDISFLSSDEYIKFPEWQVVKDWDSFKGLSHIICNWTPMDGNVYRIDKPNPIPVWRHHDYICGFDNFEYDIYAVCRLLKKRKWIKNVEIVEIPFYNRYEGRTHAVEFDYKLSDKKELATRLSKEPLFKDHYFGV